MTEIPELTPQDLSLKLANPSALIILDVREAFEVEFARLEDPRTHYLPMSRLWYDGIEALPEALQDKAHEIVVVCHHGVRSADVTVWLLEMGWQRVFSLAGGLAAYAAEIDPTIGQY